MEADIADEMDATEALLVGDQALRLPSHLCNDDSNSRSRLDEVFSLNSWNAIPSHVQEFLVRFLPSFGKDDQTEKIKTLKMLFCCENFFFGNPLEEFKDKLLNGEFNPDAVKMRRLLRKIELRHSRENEEQRQLNLLHDILLSRQRLLHGRCDPLPGEEGRVAKGEFVSDLRHRVSQRYFEELKMIRSEVGEDGHSSEDEIYPEGPPAKVSPASRGDIDRMYSYYIGGRAAPTPVDGATTTMGGIGSKRRYTNNKKAKNSPSSYSLLKRKANCHNSRTRDDFKSRNKRKKDVPSPSLRTVSNEETKDKEIVLSSVRHQAMEVPSLTPGAAGIVVQTHLKSLLMQTSTPKMIQQHKGLPVPKLFPSSSSNNLPVATTASLPSPRHHRPLAVSPPPKVAPKVNDKEVVEEAVANIPGIPGTDSLKKVLPETTPTSSGENLLLAASSSFAEGKADYVCFFSLLRDKFRSCPDHKMTLGTLEDSLLTWQNAEASSASSSCMWFGRCGSWLEEIPSALAFLMGAFPDDLRPKDFKSFVNCGAGNLFCWIGAGRDSDVNLMALTQWWLERKNLAGSFILPSMKNIPDETFVMENEDPLSVFHRQESERLSNPSKSYTFKGGLIRKGETVTVGPIRTTGNSSVSSDSHSLLIDTRPPFLTLMLLVRDALARLQGGEGTLIEICKLVKQSQFLKAQLETALLAGPVSEALERLQGEPDPPCKFRVDTRTWRYLHRGRTENDFYEMQKKQKRMIAMTAFPDDLMRSAVDSILPHTTPRSGLGKQQEQTTPTLKLARDSGNGSQVAVSESPSNFTLDTALAATPTKGENVQMVQVLTPQGVMKTYCLSPGQQPPGTIVSSHSVAAPKLSSVNPVGQKSLLHSSARPLNYPNMTTLTASQKVMLRLPPPVAGVPKQQQVVVRKTDGNRQSAASGLQRIITSNVIKSTVNQTSGGTTAAAAAAAAGGPNIRYVDLANSPAALAGNVLKILSSNPGQQHVKVVQKTDGSGSSSSSSNVCFVPSSGALPQAGQQVKVGIGKQVILAGTAVGGSSAQVTSMPSGSISRLSSASYTSHQSQIESSEKQISQETLYRLGLGGSVRLSGPLPTSSSLHNPR